MSSLCIVAIVCQKKILKFLLDVNILLSEKRAIHQEGELKLETGLKFRGISLQVGV